MKFAHCRNVWINFTEYPLQFPRYHQVKTNVYSVRYWSSPRWLLLSVPVTSTNRLAPNVFRNFEYFNPPNPQGGLVDRPLRRAAKPWNFWVSLAHRKRFIQTETFPLAMPCRFSPCEGTLLRIRHSRVDYGIQDIRQELTQEREGGEH